MKHLEFNSELQEHRFTDVSFQLGLETASEAMDRNLQRSFRGAKG